MCGIFGVVGRKELDVADRLLEGIKKLEYRGYDSSGIAILANDQIRVCKVKGKVSDLVLAANQNMILQPALAGISHTRWATHGIPSDVNAHPHVYGNVAVVHNGIIENYEEIKLELLTKGYKFLSDTDTEIVPILLSDILLSENNLIDAVKNMVKRLKGSYALGILVKSNDQNKLILIKNGSPLVVGISDDKVYYASSDVYALSKYCKQVSYLEDGDIVFFVPDFTIIDKNGNQVRRKLEELDLSLNYSDKGKFPTYMLKEIFEQVESSTHCIKQYQATNLLANLLFDVPSTKDITIVACGTSYYSANVAKYLFESVAEVRVNVEIASEYRYRDIIFDDTGVVIFISQSGETKDTLSALEFAKKNNQYTIALVNVIESSIARLADFVMPIYAGPEIGVASTKVFTNQLIVLGFLATYIAGTKGRPYDHAAVNVIPQIIEKILSKEDDIKALAKIIKNAHSLLYIARGILYPVAEEAALKLKELSYIHAEAIAAGELKHGTMALIDCEMPVIVFAMSNSKEHDKIIANIQEIIARDAKLIIFGDKGIINNFINKAVYTVEIPKFDCYYHPFIFTILAQLTAYYTADELGRDIDQPRNLAKSVTVE